MRRSTTRFIPVVLWLMLLSLVACGQPNPFVQTQSAPERASEQYNYLIEYSEAEGSYRASRVSGPMGRCEQAAAEGKRDRPKYKFLCQRGVTGDYEHFDSVHRVGEDYFVTGTFGRSSERKGAVITKDDVETVIEFAECSWKRPELANSLRFTDDQNPHDTAQRMLGEIPHVPNYVRDIRIDLGIWCQSYELGG